MKTKWLILIIGGIVAVMLVAAWVQRPKALPVVSQQPVVLRTYTDPGRLFSVSVPSSWSLSSSAASSSTGLNTLHPLHQAIQITQFSLPAEMGLTIQVVKGQPSCPLAAPLTTSLAGFPASYNPALFTWSIPTQSATVLVSVAYPGTDSFHGSFRSSPLTPFPLARVAADKQLVASLLASLKFSGLTPFVCE